MRLRLSTGDVVFVNLESMTCKEDPVYNSIIVAVFMFWNTEFFTSTKELVALIITSSKNPVYLDFSDESGPKLELLIVRVLSTVQNTIREVVEAGSVFVLETENSLATIILRLAAKNLPAPCVNSISVRVMTECCASIA